MTKRSTRVAAKNPAPRSESAESVERVLRGTFSAAVVDELREQTGYNPRQRSITAQRLMLVVVEAFLLGQTLGFTAIRAIFVRRFGFVGPCPFQKRFKQASAAAFFRAALETGTRWAHSGCADCFGWLRRGLRRMAHAAPAHGWGRGKTAHTAQLRSRAGAT